jgi:hypothetical protein
MNCELIFAIFTELTLRFRLLTLVIYLLEGMGAWKMQENHKTLPIQQRGAY